MRKGREVVCTPQDELAMMKVLRNWLKVIKRPWQALEDPVASRL